MDYKTQILQELVEAVEKLNNPDLWSVGATVLAAVVAAVITYVLGKRQNELQKQQLKIQERQNELQAQQVKLQEQQIAVQEYDIYSKMFSLVKEAERISGNILNMIYNYFSSPIFKAVDKNMLSKELENICELKQKLNSCSIDFDLKLSQDYSAMAYVDLLTDAEMVLQMFVNMEMCGEIKFKEDDWELNAVLLSNRANDITILINAIADRVVEEEKESIKRALIGFSNHRTAVLELELANDIKKRCATK